MVESFLLLSDLSLLVRDDFDESAEEFIIQVISSHELFGCNRRVRVKVSMQSHALSANIHIHFKLLDILRWTQWHSRWRLFLLLGYARRRWSVSLNGFHVSTSHISIRLPIGVERVLIALFLEVDIVFWEVHFAHLSLPDRICMQELPFVFKETLLLSMPCSQWSIWFFLIFVWLEWCLSLQVFFMLSQSLLLFI